ncbi:cytochrome P450 [Aspergillus stella-maris]|uniref:cytochrome P450 n=1 Tax=Aspergillus stella-maris TaxID=1810926 RepID=UPI003CCDAC4D
MPPTLLLLPLALCAIYLLYKHRTSPLHTLPGPFYTSYTSLLLKWHYLRGRRMHYVHRLHARYGPIVRVSPSEISVSDPADVKTVHRIGTPFLKDETFYKRITRPDIENLFNTSDPGFHSQRRKLFSGQMSQFELHRPEIESLITARVDLAISRMTLELKDTRKIDILQWFVFMATDIIGELCFGDSFRMLELGRGNQYYKDLTAVARLEGVKVVFPSLLGLVCRVWGWRIALYVPVVSEAVAAGERLGRYAVESVGRYRALLEDSQSEGKEPMKKTFFTKLFQLAESTSPSTTTKSTSKLTTDDDEHQETDTRLPDKSITDEAITFIVAGSDTTATTLTYLIYTLLQPSQDSTLHSLLAELSILPQKYTDKDLIPLQTLNNIILETLRLYSGVPSALPRTSATAQTLSGYTIPGGITVSSQTYTLHRNADIFPSPEIFNPNRWINPTRDMKESFMPFGSGTRTCLGIHLAKMEVRLAAARFFLTFKDKLRVHEDMENGDMDMVAWFLGGIKAGKCLVRRK